VVMSGVQDQTKAREVPGAPPAIVAFAYLLDFGYPADPPRSKPIRNPEPAGRSTEVVHRGRW